jgi:hypothetical protein
MFILLLIDGSDHLAYFQFNQQRRMEGSSPGALFGGDAWGGCTWSVFGLSSYRGRLWANKHPCHRVREVQAHFWMRLIVVVTTGSRLLTSGQLSIELFKSIYVLGKWSKNVSTLSELLRENSRVQ